MKKQQLLKKSFLLTLCLYSALLFSNAQAGVLRLTDYSYVAIMQTLYNGPKEGSPYLAADDFLFGEEFEYWVILDKNEDTHDIKVHFKAVNNLVNKWEQRIIEKVTELKIPENEYQLTKSTKKQPTRIGSGLRPPDENILTVKIGNWYCKIHPDFWIENGPGGSHAMLEISASPYKFDQTFIVAGREFTAYKMIDTFISDIFQSFSAELIPASGHKHLDITSSLCGNTELIFRLLLDIENKAWLSQALGTEKDSLSSFRYVSQGKKSDLKQDNLMHFTFHFNDYIQSLQHFSSSIDPEDTFQNHVYSITRDFKCSWKAYFQHLVLYGEGFMPCVNERFFPVDLRFYRKKNSEGHQRALEGKIVDHPDGTLEFRFFDTARSGHEARLINQLLVKWIQHIHKNQLQKQPVSYLPYNPLQECPYSYLTVKEKFNTFITMLGLNPDEYQVIFRMKE